MNIEKKQFFKDLCEIGKNKGTLTNREIMDAIDEITLDAEQMEKLYDMLMRIPASEKTSPSYYSLISVLHFTKYHKTDSNAEVVKKLEEYLDSELSKKRHARRSRKPVALISGS